ncbi:MAG: YraN family protein [Pseudomonadota bacterium]
MSHSLIGKKAEDVAHRFLKNNGLTLISRNYQCKYGEIDLIMQDKETLVFVEVRYRKSDKFGSATESVDRNKQRKIIFTANHYLCKTNTSLATRFDVIALKPNESPLWIIDAFTADDG